MNFSVRTPFGALVIFIFITALAPTPLFGAEGKLYMSAEGQLGYARFLYDGGDPLRAAREYERVVVLFAGSAEAEEAAYMAGRAWLDSRRFAEASRSLALFLRDFGGSPLAPKARGEFAMAERLLAASKVKRLLPEGDEIDEEADEAPRSAEELRAVQVMLFDGATYKEIGKELSAMKRAGVNTIIVRVFHNKGDRFYPVVKAAAKARAVDSGVYFRTSHAPVIADLLGPVVKMAHARRLKVFAWMTTRYADYGIEDRDDLSCVAYEIKGGGYEPCKGLDLFNDEAVRHLESIYRDLSAYDIDGVLFQDDLVLRHNEGFGAAASELYLKEKGKPLNAGGFYVARGEGAYVDYTRSFWEWARWKNTRLLKVAGRLRDVVTERNTRVKFAINLMYESVTNPPGALAWLSQDLEAARATGFDYYSIMAYHRQMGEELGKERWEVEAMIERMVGDATRVVGDPRRVLVKIQTVDWSTGKALPDREVADFIRGVKGAGGVSVAVVPYRAGFPFDELSRRAAKGGASRVAKVWASPPVSGQ